MAPSFPRLRGFTRRLARPATLPPPLSATAAAWRAEKIERVVVSALLLFQRRIPPPLSWGLRSAGRRSRGRRCAFPGRVRLRHRLLLVYLGREVEVLLNLKR